MISIQEALKIEYTIKWTLGGGKCVVKDGVKSEFYRKVRGCIEKKSQVTSTDVEAVVELVTGDPRHKEFFDFFLLWLAI